VKPANDSRIVGSACKLVVALSVFSVFATLAQASTSVQPLFTFPCDSTGIVCPNGATPTPLIQSVDGNFYGTTNYSGTGNKAAGTVFRLTPTGQLTTLFTFVADQNGNYPNGANRGGVIEGNDGLLYGSTVSGGANNTGVVFKLSKAGAFKIIHVGGAADLTLGRDRNLYGFGPDSAGNPAVVRITTGGSYTVLHTLNAKTDGIYPAGLILASDGNLYGTTVDAEVAKITSLFRVTPAGQFTVLQQIHYGMFFVSPPIQSASGHLYAGLNFVPLSNGTLPPGLLEHDLSSTGFQLIALPYAVQQWIQEVMEASDGNFWGVSSRIGKAGGIVSFTHSGAAVQEIDFGGWGLMQASDGRILGVAGNEIFALAPALAPPKPLFVSPGTSSGKVGSQVTIHGSHFVGTARVTFNGVSASFKVLNTGNILATVPVGATTGPLK
jgi:uncharacterized repeat protein (TIGR03803 family)